MLTDLEERLVRDRLDEALAYAARERLVSTLRATRPPVRVLVGLSMIRVGRWLAGRASEAAGEPGRVTA